jgi:hypothetical protein
MCSAMPDPERYAKGLGAPMQPFTEGFVILLTGQPLQGANRLTVSQTSD